MKLFAFLITLVVCLKVLALPPIKNVEQMLNQGQMTPAVQLGTQLVSHKIQVLKCQWKYSRQGGAVSTMNLQTVDGAPCKLPNKAIVVKSWIDEVSNVTSGDLAACMISVGTGQGADDLKVSTSAGGYSSVMNTLADWTASSAIKMTAERTPTLTVASTAITGGQLNVFISYLISD